MAQAMLNVRINSEDKSRFEEFCKQTGLNISTCRLNMFVKAVLQERKFPFEMKAAPAFDKEVMPTNQVKSIERVPAEVNVQSAKK